MDSISARLVMLDAYEVTYGIFNHADAALSVSRPLALVAMHDKENVTVHSELYNTIRRFRRYKVSQHFGMSLTEFLSMPTEYCNMILQMLGDEAAKDAEALAAKMRDLEKQQNGHNL